MYSLTGFPSPAEEYARPSLSLDALLIRSPLATHFIKFEGDAMDGENIHDGDLLVAEKSLHYPPGCIVLAFVDGQRIVRKFVERNGVYYLCPAADGYKDIRLNDSITIFGRVLYAITRFLQIKNNLPTAN